MAELRIPEEYERGFAEIRRLDEKQLRDLVSALESEPPTLRRAELRSRVASRVDTVARDDVDQVIDALISLHALRDSMGVETPVVLEAISDAMNESGVEDLEFDDDEDRKRFKAHLVQLLAVDTLDISAKANDLLYDHERTIHGPMRVLTDIRPVFGEDPGKEPNGAVIVQTLKITYHESAKIKEFFIALDTEQVDELIGVLGRASLKAEGVKRLLAGTKASYIEAE